MSTTQASQDTSSSSTLPPRKRARWMYASGTTWATFQEVDDEKLEKKWNQLGGSKWAASIKQKQNKAVEESSDEEHTNTLKRPQQVKAPPSGVDAIRSALDNVVNFPDKAKEAAEDKIDENSTSSSAFWIKALQKLGIVDGSDRKDKDAAESASEQKPNTDEDGKVHVNHILDPDEPEENRKFRVEVLEDNLFDVDLETMTLYPVFWKGVLIKVVRATWFYSSLTDGAYVPISFDDDMSQDLDNAYEQAKPWLTSASQLSTEDLGKDKRVDQDQVKLFPLPSMDDNGEVLFQDAQVGRVFSQNLRGRALSILGGSVVVRGFDRAEQIAKDYSFKSFSSFSLPWASGDPNKQEQGQNGGRTESTFGSRFAGKDGAAKTDGAPRSGGGADGPREAPKSSNGDKDVVQSFATKLVPSSDAMMKPIIAFKKFLGYDQDEAADEEKRKMKQQMTEDELGRQERDNEIEQLPDDRKDEPPDLVFAIHGIGQQLTEDFEALDFVYDVEHLRHLAGKNATDPAIRRLSRGRRAQFLPICWRKLVEFDDEPEENDNFYTLNDITNSAAIPMVRNVISKVVLDVPFYLSRHREKMIRSVIQELNRTYRLFCRRNPDFERKGGRVNLIGHSLGSALASDILSAQPTKVPLLYELQESDRAQEAKSAKHLHFNVRNVFFIGSPVAFFFYLGGGQLIARSGTDRNPTGKDTNQDAVSSSQGKYGCLAAESVYNIFNPNDPVAFQLAPTVDATYASLVKPISIEAAAEALLRSCSLPRISVSRIFEKYGEHPFGGVGHIIRRARIMADEKDPQLPDNLTEQEQQETEDRKLGKQIMAESDYIQKVQTMQQLDMQRRNKREKSDSATGKSEQSVSLTEAGSRKKALQPEQALREAQDRGFISNDVDDKDSKYDLDHLELAQRRFSALNPHGCIDFHLSATISLSGYLDMFGAHLAYWTHPDFATFVLIQLFMDYKADDSVTLVPGIQLPTEPAKTKGDQSSEDGEEESQEEPVESEEDT